MSSWNLQMPRQDHRLEDIPEDPEERTRLHDLRMERIEREDRETRQSRKFLNRSLSRAVD